MVSEKVKTFFGKVRKGLDEKWEKLREIKREDIAKFATKEAVGAIPVVGQIIKDAIDEFSPDEKEELIKELKVLSESQFKEISEKVGVSIEYLEEIREITLYSFEELQAYLVDIIKKKDVIEKRTEKIEDLLGQLIKILTREVKPPEIDIPNIKSVLEKEKISEGEFFRIEPKWIDFEEGFVVERKEVDEIIRKLEKDNIQLVVGEPASGKSVILKNIGFKLAKKGHSVYIIELKHWQQDSIESYFKGVRKIDDERTLIIVDDAHLQLSKCEELVRDFRYKNLRTKLIIGARDVKEFKESRTEEFTTEESEFKNLALTEIHAIDATEKMIYLFLTEKYRVRDEHLIETVSRGLKEYKHDLWYLSWALKVYDKDTDTVNKEKIYSAIAKKIEKIKGEDVFLPLSVFYRFEIPIEKKFLTKILEINDDCIDGLIKISEICEIKERGITMLAMHHSSLASLYFEIYQRTDLFPELGENIKERITEQSKYGDDLERGLFYLYLTSKPTNLSEVLFRLNLKNVRRRVEDIAEASEEEALKLVDAVATRIVLGGSNVRTEITPDVIGTFLNFIASVSKRVAQEIFNRFNPELREAIGPISEVPGYRLVRRYKK